MNSLTIPAVTSDLYNERRDNYKSFLKGNIQEGGRCQDRVSIIIPRIST